MRRAILCLVGALGLAPIAAGAAPLPRLSQLAARHQDAIVRVLSPDGEVLSSGFFVASVGYVAAAVPRASVGEGVVVELASGARRRGLVVRAEPRGPLVIVAVAAASDDELFPTLPFGGETVRAGSEPERTTRTLPAGWLVALCHDDEGRVMPAAGGLRELDDSGAWLLDLPCGRGAAVLSGDRVVGVTVRARGVTASTGVGIERVVALSRGLRPKRPTELSPSPPAAQAEAAAPSAAPRAAR